ncbi:MAG: hypothetical protein AB1776_08430 [Bacillota bacterium]
MRDGVRDRMLKHLAELIGGAGSGVCAVAAAWPLALLLAAVSGRPGAVLPAWGLAGLLTFAARAHLVHLKIRRARAAWFLGVAAGACLTVLAVNTVFPGAGADLVEKVIDFFVLRSGELKSLKS